MTRINKLIMHGFKSFAKRTELVFGKEFNCVLGPNGSGKSNIIDALCFVLGKTSAKALRSEKSANLIYNGGKSKKPAEYAEVSIVFDNSEKTFPTDDPEVKVSRKVRKNGQSIYKINDESRTRQQIVELLSIARIDPDSYHIILQGDIIRFVEMAPEERRGLVEDIAGISLYEDKKLKAVNELDRVEERLKEAEIVLNERKNRLNELKKEKDQAIKFKDLKEKIRLNKASLIHKRITTKKEETDVFDKRILGNKEKLDARNQEIAELKKEIHEWKTKIDTINKEIEQKGEKDQIDINKNIEKLRVDIASSKNRKETVKNEISKIKQRKIQLNQNLEELTDKIKDIDKERKEIQEMVDRRQKEVQQIEKRMEDFRKKNNLDSVGSLEKEIDAVDKEAEDLQKKIQDFRQEQQELLREKDRVEIQIQAIDEKIAKVSQVEKENEAQFKELKKNKEEFRKFTADLSRRTADNSALMSQTENARISLIKVQEELSKIRTRKMSIQERLGENSALKKVLDQKEKIKGIYGTVSELGKVPSKYSLALEIAAGPKTTSVVVADDKVASQCIKYLKDNKLGVVTFLPLNKIRPRKEESEVNTLAKGNGVHGFALDLISYDSRFSNVFSYVFGNTLIVDGVDTARRIGIGRAKMVTLDGDVSERSGAMQGGFRKKGSSGLGFSEKEIDNAIEDVKKQNSISQQELLSTLARSGLTFKEYREQLKDQIRQVKFTNKEFRSNVKISHEDVETYYRQNQDKFSGPLMHKLRIISLLATDQGRGTDTEEKAKQVLSMIRRGEDFAKLAKEYSHGPDAQEGGDLGYVKAGEMDKAIEKVAAGLKIGEISDIIKTSTGFHIIQVIDRKKREPQPLAAVEGEIRNIIFQKIIDERYKIWLEEIMKKAYIEVRL